MSYTKEYKRKQKALMRGYPYCMIFWKDFDFEHLGDYISVKTRGGHKGTTYNDIIIMADTETSKKDLKKDDNHIVAWSICLRAYHYNIVTLWGQDPWDLVEMFSKLRKTLKGQEIYIYWHNTSYDWAFIRKFCLAKFGTPEKQLNIRPYYPLIIKFANGIVFKDSLVLAARSLDKWAKDMNVEHQKALGKWDYNKYRNQSDVLTDDELLYIENDVRAGVECIDALLLALKKNISSIPYTNTGIIRDTMRKIGKQHKAHENYVKLAPEWRLQQILELIFHGGFTHANRYCTVRGANHGIYQATCYDISSSYPFCILAYRYPAEKFWPIEKTYNDIDFIKKNADDYAIICHCTFKNIRLKDPHFPMPLLSMYKALCTIDAINDNGRATEIKVAEYYLNEIDLLLIDKYYTWDSIIIDGVYVAFKDYLPRWFTDKVYELYKNKCNLKNVDDILYSLSKSQINSTFGMAAQHPVSTTIEENYQAGANGEDPYNTKLDIDFEAEYEKHVKNRNSFLPYQWGVWITAYAQRNLFELGECIDYENGGIWVYSDTDSTFGTLFNDEKLKEYNDTRIKLLEDRGYPGVKVKDKIYHLGVAEFDKSCMQFRTLHSKCYVYRPLKAVGDNFLMGDDLKLTTAGVPKKGVNSLHNNIENFRPYFTFDGKTSGKLAHTHIYVEEIYTDRNGNVTGDSINLKPCDYILSDANRANILNTDYMEVELPAGGYEDEEYQLNFFNEEILRLF